MYVKEFVSTLSGQEEYTEVSLVTVLVDQSVSVLCRSGWSLR